MLARGSEVLVKDIKRSKFTVSQAECSLSPSTTGFWSFQVSCRRGQKPAGRTQLPIVLRGQALGLCVSSVSVDLS